MSSFLKKKRRKKKEERNEKKIKGNKRKVIANILLKSYHARSKNDPSP